MREYCNDDDDDDKVIKRQWKEQEAAKASVKLHKLQPYPTLGMANRYDVQQQQLKEQQQWQQEQHKRQQQQQQQQSQQARLINKEGDQAKQTNESAKDKRAWKSDISKLYSPPTPIPSLDRQVK